MEAELAVLEVRGNRDGTGAEHDFREGTRNYWITIDWINVDEDEEEKLNNDTIVALNVVIKEMKLGSKK